MVDRLRDISRRIFLKGLVATAVNIATLPGPESASSYSGATVEGGENPAFPTELQFILNGFLNKNGQGFLLPKLGADSKITSSITDVSGERVKSYYHSNQDGTENLIAITQTSKDVERTISIFATSQYKGQNPEDIAQKIQQFLKVRSSFKPSPANDRVSTEPPLRFMTGTSDNDGKPNNKVLFIAYLPTDKIAQIDPETGKHCFIERRITILRDGEVFFYEVRRPVQPPLGTI